MAIVINHPLKDVSKQAIFTYGFYLLTLVVLYSDYTGMSNNLLGWAFIIISVSNFLIAGITTGSWLAMARFYHYEPLRVRRIAERQKTTIKKMVRRAYITGVLDVAIGLFLIVVLHDRWYAKYAGASYLVLRLSYMIRNSLVNKILKKPQLG